MHTDDETTATQLVKIVNATGYDISTNTIVRARRILGWTFHGSRYCQIIRTQNKEKRMEWACENLHKNFENIVWTDESMIQLENHCTFFCLQESQRSSKTEGAGKASLQSNGMGRYLKKRCHQHLSSQQINEQRCLPSQSHLVPFLQKHLPDGSVQQAITFPCSRHPLKALIATLLRICGMS